MIECPECLEQVESHVIDDAGLARMEQVCLHPDKRKPQDADGSWPMCVGGDRIRLVYTWPRSKT